MLFIDYSIYLQNLDKNEFCVFTVMPNFAQRVEVAVDAISSNPPKDVDENEFIDASRLVYDGVREIRRAVLMNRVSCHGMKIYEHYTFLLCFFRYLGLK